MKISKEEIKKEREKNFKERLKFIEFWANYIKTHDDKVWSRQQNVIIDSQLGKKTR